nr:hypothetical protein [uncultured Treponema sp.]
MHGEQYFVGKTEDDLIKYFEEKGIELPNKEDRNAARKKLRT